MSAKQLTQGKILKALHAGAQIMRDHISHPPSDERVTYRLTSNQKLVNPALVQQLIADGLIQANDDCLAGIGESQTYSLVRGA